MKIKKRSKIKICREKNKINDQHGITLMALIVTIIILLILAGVTINIAIRTKWVI